MKPLSVVFVAIKQRGMQAGAHMSSSVSFDCVWNCDPWDGAAPVNLPFLGKPL